MLPALEQIYLHHIRASEAGLATVHAARQLGNASSEEDEYPDEPSGGVQYIHPATPTHAIRLEAMKPRTANRGGSHAALHTVRGRGTARACLSLWSGRLGGTV